MNLAVVLSAVRRARRLAAVAAVIIVKGALYMTLFARPVAGRLRCLSSLGRIDRFIAVIVTGRVTLGRRHSLQ